MLPGDQKDVQKRPESVAHIREPEVDRRQWHVREAIPLPVRDQIHSHKVPTIRVIEASGAPILKYSRNPMDTPCWRISIFYRELVLLFLAL